MKEPYYLKKKKAFYKRKEFFTILIGAFFILLMALSAVNIGSHNQDNSQGTVIEYNGVEFESSQLGWSATAADGSNILITYSPETITDEELNSVNFINLHTTNKIYLSVHAEEAYQLAVRDFQTNFNFNAQYVNSCWEDHEACTELPLKTCEDAIDSVGVVEFREADESFVTFEDNCLVIQGKDLLKVTDKLVLDYYGI